MKHIYLDNNATTRIAPEVLEAMLPYLKDSFANPSSFHSFGNSVEDDIENARKNVARLIGANSEEIIFTSGGTEGDNWALKSAVRINRNRTLVVISSVEHPAVLEAADYLREEGFRVDRIGVFQDGSLKMNDLRKAVGSDTALVSIMTANNESGIIFPLEEISKIAHEAGAYFHTDAVQAIGKVAIDVNRMGIDMLSMSAHKFHGPKGVGAFYLKSGIRLPRFIHGGHHERGFRAGTYNVPGIIGLGEAARLALEYIDVETKETEKLRDMLQDGIIRECPGAYVLGAESPRLPNTVTMLFSGVESESILMLLDMKKIFVSSGSACSTGSKDPSYVLLAMDIPQNDANSAIRFSLSRYTTKEEIEFTIETLKEIIKKLRNISPFT